MNIGFYSRVSVAVLSALFSSCRLKDDQSHLLIYPLTFDFTESEHGWTDGFATIRLVVMILLYSN
jgi:hypothetical protein